MQEAAASALWNVATDAHARAAILNAGAIGALVPLMSSPAEGVRRAAEGTLEILVGSGNVASIAAGAPPPPLPANVSEEGCAIM